MKLVVFHWKLQKRFLKQVQINYLLKQNLFITLDPLDVTSERLRSLHNVILGVVAVEMFLHQPSSDADQRAEAKSRIRRRETAGPSERHQILAW